MGIRTFMAAFILIVENWKLLNYPFFLELIHQV